MMIDLQKANFGKRIIAAIFDFIFLSLLVVGFATLLSAAFGYDSHMNTVNEAYEKYETEYNVEFNLTQEKYEELSDEQRENYDAAYKALNQDEKVVYSDNMLINLTLLIATLSILIGVLIVEFAMPLILGNGQTAGKKIFGIGLMHVEGIKVSNLQLFARAILGKFAIEIMIPLSVIMMIFFNLIGFMGGIIFIVILAVEVICLITSRTNSLLHDVMSGTVAVDIASQRIFENREELIEYTKKIHAERAEKSAY